VVTLEGIVVTLEGSAARAGSRGRLTERDVGYGRIGRVYSRRMLLPRREMSAP
jgi:hypothetical protein